MSYLVTPLTLAEHAFGPIEKRGRRVHRLDMNMLDYAQVRKFGRDVADFVTEADLLAKGYVCTIWGAEVRVSGNVTPGTILIEDDFRRCTRLCLRCKSFFYRARCETKLCVVADVQES